MFGVFMLSWIVARHVIYPMVCWSVYAHTPVILPTGCFKGPSHDAKESMPAPAGYGYLLEPFGDMEGLVCYNETVKWAFLYPLLSLLGLILVWFTRIIRVALKVLRGDGAEDNRSDDEAEDEDEYIYEEAQPLEADVGVEDIDLRNWERRSGVKRQSSATGVSLPGHSDRKELLGRIGCEKQVD